MFKTKRKHLIAVFLMLIALMISTVSIAEELPEMKSVSITPEGILTWDPFDGANEYYVSVVHQEESDNFGGYYDSGVNLKDEADSFKVSSGTYDVKVWAKNSSRDTISKEVISLGLNL